MSSRELITSNKSEAALSALVLTDNRDSAVVNKVLSSHGFKVVSTADADTAEELCRRQRFDLAVFDQDVSGALELAGKEGSQPRVSVGLFPGKSLKHNPGARFHFIVHKPLTVDLLSKIVKASYSSLATTQRASARFEVDIAVEDCNMFSHELRSLSGVRLVNLSRTGLCLQAGEMLPQGATIEVTFTLPSIGEVQLSGTVVWAHASGRAGIKLNELNPDGHRKLETCLATQWCSDMQPQAV